MSDWSPDHPTTPMRPTPDPFAVRELQADRCVPNWAAVCGMLLTFTGVCILLSVVAVLAFGADEGTCILVSIGVLSILGGMLILSEVSKAKDEQG